jgi:uncharacterized membrane protein YhaH (DUF805 family)
MAIGVVLLLVILYVAVIVLSVVAWVKIISKAGYNGWWVLIAVVPVVNLVMFLVFAFSRWPALEERDRFQGDSPWPRRSS